MRQEVSREAAPGEATILLARIRGGDRDALAELVPLVYLRHAELSGEPLA